MAGDWKTTLIYFIAVICTWNIIKVLLKWRTQRLRSVWRGKGHYWKMAPGPSPYHVAEGTLCECHGTERFTKSNA